MPAEESISSAKFRWRIISLLVTYALVSSFFWPWPVLGREVDGVTTTSGCEIPFSLLGGFVIVIEGRIGNLNGLKLILDTGTAHSVVDRKVAEKLRVPRYPERMFNFNKFVEAETAIFPDVQFGGVRFASASMLVADLARLSAFANHADALIGSDLLSSQNLTINYDAKTVLFSSPCGSSNDGTLNSHAVYMIAEFQAQGQPLRLLVDTGLPDILLFEDRVQKRRPQLKMQSEAGGFLVAGRLRARRVILLGVEMGKTRTNLVAFLAEGPPEHVLPDVDGVLGTPALKVRRVHINFLTQTFAWGK